MKTLCNVNAWSITKCLLLLLYMEKINKQYSVLFLGCYFLFFNKNIIILVNLEFCGLPQPIFILHFKNYSRSEVFKIKCIILTVSQLYFLYLSKYILLKSCRQFNHISLLFFWSSDVQLQGFYGLVSESIF